jgi:tungstate transport system substrate-binding protein
MRRFLLVGLLVALGAGGCKTQEPAVLRLATTTSTEDSGLLDSILPAFEKAYGARVDVVAVGTGQALALGQSGDADVLLVHAPAKEKAFVEAGHGTARYDVMYNDFIVLGPPGDPASVREASSAADALRRIAQAGAAFASRGDDSGTHSKELALWKDAGIDVGQLPQWYLSVGQGMGETLLFAGEMGAYTLSDRGTYLATHKSLPGLAILFGGNTIAENPDPNLYNPYGVIPVNPALHPAVEAELGRSFVSWLTSLETQEVIGEFGLETYDQPLFYPDSQAWRSAHP